MDIGYKEWSDVVWDMEHVNKNTNCTFSIVDTMGGIVITMYDAESGTDFVLFNENNLSFQFVDTALITEDNYKIMLKKELRESIRHIVSEMSDVADMIKIDMGE